jgi:hypothetical protein
VDRSVWPGVWQVVLCGIKFWSRVYSMKLVITIPSRSRYIHDCNTLKSLQLEITMEFWKGKEKIFTPRWEL